MQRDATRCNRVQRSTGPAPNEAAGGKWQEAPRDGFEGRNSVFRESRSTAAGGSPRVHAGRGPANSTCWTSMPRVWPMALAASAVSAQMVTQVVSPVARLTPVTKKVAGVLKLGAGGMPTSGCGATSYAATAGAAPTLG